MGVRMCMCGLFLDPIGNLQDIMAIVTTMSHPNGLTIVMGGRTMDIREISEERVVEEMVVIEEVVDKDRGAFIPKNWFNTNLAT